MSAPNGEGFETVEVPGGPDQNMVEVVVNISSFRFAQTGSLGLGGLVRWKVYNQGIPVKAFNIVPSGAALPLMTGSKKIAGYRGVTHWYQVISEPSGRKDYGFVVEIGETTVRGSGLLVVDGALPKAELSPAARSAAKRKKK
jgi:hypothetical protein